MSRIHVAILILLSTVGCVGGEFQKSRSKPSDQGSEVPGFDLETIQSVAAGSASIIEISKTTLSIPLASTKKDAEVRLRTLNAVPSNDEVADLGDAKSDIIEITMYDKGTGVIFGSELLGTPYEFNQTLDGVENIKNINYIVITLGGTENETVTVLSNEALTISESTVPVGSVNVTFYLNLTSAVVFAIEIDELPTDLDVSSDSGKISNSAGGIIASSPPEAPSELNATAGSSESISLVWSDNSSNEISFKIERRRNNETFTALITTAPDAVSFSDVSVSASTTYYYRIRACNSEGCSDFAESGAVTSLAGVSIPAAPSGLVVSFVSHNLVTLTWIDNSNNETSINVERSSDGTTYSTLGSIGADSVTHSDATVVAATSYFYRVRACNAAGCSSYATPAQANTPVATHRLFVSSAQYTGNLGGLVGADAKCQALADAQSLGSNWKAILSDSTDSAASRLSIIGEIFNLKPVPEKIAVDAAALWNTNSVDLLAPPRYSETGSEQITYPWSGTIADGSAEIFHCSDWSDATNTSQGRKAFSGDIDDRWLTYPPASDCDEVRSIYCIDGQ